MSQKELLLALRKKTGASIGDIVKALKESGDSMEKAEEILRKHGVAKASKRNDHITKEGVIGQYVHANKKIAAMVELLCETDFVARNEVFLSLAHDIAMQIVATFPLYVRPEDIPADILEKEKQIIAEQSSASAKSQEILAKIVEGKMQKYYEEVCLLKQTFFKDEAKTVEELMAEKISILGEKIDIGKFTRFQI